MSSFDNNSTSPKQSPKGMNFKSLKSLLGVSNELTQQQLSSNRINSLNRYTPTETQSLLNKSRVKPHDTTPLAQQGLLNYLEPVHKEIVRVKHDAQRFYVLAPEIQQASLILVSSILSPNDLQDGELIFDVNLSKLSENVKSEIIELSSTYFNTTYELGVKLADWYEEALFKSGAQPILILSDTKLTQLIHDSSHNKFLDERSLVASSESFDALINKSLYSKSNDDMKSTFEQLVIGKESFFTEDIRNDKVVGMKPTNKLIDEFINPIYMEMRNDFMALLNDNPLNTNTDKSLNEFKAAIEDTTIKIMAELKDGDLLKISENPEILKFHNVSLNSKKQNMTTAYLNSINNQTYSNDQMLAIPDIGQNEGTEAKSHPVVMVLPPESVIPICVPGNKSEHIGYFILIDESGAPIRVPMGSFEDTSDCNANCGNGQAALAFDAMFGNSCGMKNGINRFGRNISTDISSKVFEYMIDKYMSAKVKDIGLGDMEISKFNSIAQVMFNRLLFHKKTIMVFVPESLMVYYAFDYREDGTGKNKLEDASFILHLRTTFLMASILAMMNDAINHKTINVALNDKVTDPDGILEGVREMYIQKNMMKFSNNPISIAKDIQNIALSMSVDNYPGLDSFKVEPSSTPNQTQRPDNELLDNLTNMFINFIGIPHSAFNALSETEYSRSIATVNLFFSKNVKSLQRIAKKHNDKFVRLYTKFSKPLRSNISQLLEKQNISDTIKDVHGEPIQIQSLIDVIADSINTELPSPNIAPDKAQFEEVNSFIGTLDNILNVVFSNELMPNEDSETQYAMQLIRAYFKKEMTTKFLEVVGVSNMIDLPDIDNIPHNKIQQMNQSILNFNTGLRNVKKVFTADDSDSSGGFGDSDSSFGGTDSGDSDPFGDTGMDTTTDIPEDPSMNTESTEPQTDNVNTEDAESTSDDGAATDIPDAPV